MGGDDWKVGRSRAQIAFGNMYIVDDLLPDTGSDNLQDQALSSRCSMNNGCADTGASSCKHLVFCSRYHDINQDVAGGGGREEAGEAKRGGGWRRTNTCVVR